MKASVLLALLALMAVLFVSAPGWTHADAVAVGEEDADSDEVVIADEDEVADADEEEVEEEADEEEEETADEEDVEEVAELEVAAVDSSCLNGFSAAKLASMAATYQATYKKNGVVYSQPKRQFGLNVKYSDCSSFVNSVLMATGYQCLFKGSENTAAMQPLMRARGGFHSTPKVGDIVMWSGHTGIVSAKACPAGQGELIAMGVHGCAASGCLTPASMAKWGDGTFLGYWTPHA